MRLSARVLLIGTTMVVLAACGDDDPAPVATPGTAGDGGSSDSGDAVADEEEPADDGSTGEAGSGDGHDDVGGSGTDGQDSDGDGPGDADVAGVWELIEGTGPDGELTLVEGHPVTLAIGDDVGGTSACNSYGAEMERDGASVRIDLTHMTEMACMPEVMDLESAYFAALDDVDNMSDDDGTLVLTGPSTELRFDAVPEVPTADIVGTGWVLESLVEGDTVSSVAGEPATLRLEADGTFTGSTGCREMSGSYIEANGQISPTDFGMGEGECPEDLRDQDSHVVSVIEGFRARVDGDTLTLTSQGGQGLIYRAG
ncbi:META domain-containing protein [Phytoactinopolyspora endophytica]|uniref:META domain-containing protein n=1 Tax=Phytoactinopolyspora endophytica TaxID=1642495 RepID=UPI00101D8658|nr:META domain-containing protein [Phytoactinopolyspora endophytica]